VTLLKASPNFSSGVSFFVVAAICKEVGREKEVRVSAGRISAGGEDDRSLHSSEPLPTLNISERRKGGAQMS